MDPIRIGTRGSALALAQAEGVAQALRSGSDRLDVELVPIATSGDRPERASDPGDKSRFVKEIEEALLREDIDLAVHSAKDVPAELPVGLAIVGAPPAEDARDALVGQADSLDELPDGARIGTSSLRRRSQLLAIRPDLKLDDLRGNVDTRLRKLGDGRFDAIVLALAGLRRLGREAEGAGLATQVVVPAAGQGILALEARMSDELIAAAAAHVSDDRAQLRLRAERAVVSELDASCRTPVAVHAQPTDGLLWIDAYVGLPDGSEWIRDAVEGESRDPEALGRTLAERMLGAGAAELLRRAEHGIH